MNIGTEKINLANSHIADVLRARNSMGQEEPDQVWHHHINFGEMQLVQRGMHDYVDHHGGAEIWGYGRAGADPGPIVKPDFSHSFVMTQEGPPLAESEVNAFERKTNRPIPIEYRNFLINTVNGGIPSPEACYFIPGLNSASSIALLAGINTNLAVFDLRYWYELYVTLPPNAFPIGSDPLGNHLIIVKQSTGAEPVCFWEHEEFDRLYDQPDKYILAPSFNEFLESWFVTPQFLEPTLYQNQYIPHDI